MPPMKGAALIWWILGIIVVILVIWAVVQYSMSPSPGAGTTSGDAANASQVVTGFGSQLQKVSSLAPDASTTIASTYAPYVDPTLLSQWEADPSAAPGRDVSSPWPDHVNVNSATPSGSSYSVSGNIVLMTSSGEAGMEPFVAMVTPENGGWYITDFTIASSSASSSMPQ